MRTFGRVLMTLAYLYGLIFGVGLGLRFAGLLGIILALAIPLSTLAGVLELGFRTGNFWPSGLFLTVFITGFILYTVGGRQNTEKALRKASSLYQEGLINDLEYSRMKQRIIDSNDSDNN